MPTISVIIPNYNHGKYLQQRIESVLNQTYRSFEVIILDDCSGDNSREIIETYRNNSMVSHIVFNDKNSGSTFKQWKKGIALASGAYLWIAESDDWADPEFLQTLAAAISKNPQAGIAFSNSNWIDANGQCIQSLSIYKESFEKTGKEEVRNSLLKFNTIQNASAALIKKDLAEKYITSTLSYKSCGDWRLYTDILMESDMIYLGRELNYFRWHENNTSIRSNKKGQWVEEGLKIIVFSNAYRLKISFAEFKQIVQYWWRRCHQFPLLLRLKLRSASVTFLLFFFLKSLVYRIMRAHE